MCGVNTTIVHALVGVLLVGAWRERKQRGCLCVCTRPAAAVQFGSRPVFGMCSPETHRGSFASLGCSHRVLLCGICTCGRLSSSSELISFFSFFFAGRHLELMKKDAAAQSPSTFSNCEHVVLLIASPCACINKVIVSNM